MTEARGFRDGELTPIEEMLEVQKLLMPLAVERAAMIGRDDLVQLGQEYLAALAYIDGMSEAERGEFHRDALWGALDMMDES